MEKVRLGARVVPAQESWQRAVQAALCHRPDMFALKDTACATYDNLSAAGVGDMDARGGASEQDLSSWSMQRPPFAGVRDPALREAIWSLLQCKIDGAAVTFIMQLEVGGAFAVRARPAALSDDENEPPPKRRAVISDSE